MYFTEPEFSEEDVMLLLQESYQDNNGLKEQIIDPIIAVLETPKGRDEYIKYGNEFIEANVEMLAKEYPTKPVSFPRKYVDKVFELFGFEVSSFKKMLKELLKQVRQDSSFSTITENPSNEIHTVVLFYSDMILHKKLRDSARQQLGLSMYRVAYNTQFPAKFISEPVMAYTYNELDRTWSLVQAENVINWIGMTVNTSYAFWKNKLTVDMSMAVLVGFLNRTRTSFKQVMRTLSQRYYANLDKGNLIGDDTDGSDDYVITNNFITLRDNLMRRIKTGDSLYKNKGQLYAATARSKNIKVDTLYEFAQTIKYDDIANIIDLIFYVFIVKEGNTIDDINSTKFISRITNLPTAVDRAIAGKPVVLPLTKKYKFEESIVRSYICLIATYIMLRMNDIREN